MTTRTKADILQTMASNASCREDFEFIKETIESQNVFIGMLDKGSTQGSDVPFCLTIGMFLYGLPELVFAGVPVHRAQEIVSEVVLCRDTEFLAGKSKRKFSGMLTAAMPVESPASNSLFGICSDYYTLHDQGDIKVSQIVIADREGRFPWAKGYCDTTSLHQPIIGQGEGSVVAH